MSIVVKVQWWHVVVEVSVVVDVVSIAGARTELVFFGSKAAAAKSHQSCLTLCDPIDSSPPGSRPWDSPGKNTGAGCHFLLQCMKVKSESEVTRHVRLFVTPWTVAYQAPPSMGFPRQEY